jgi:hypothetical protein
MENFLAAQTKLMQQLAADTMAIKLDTESIFKNQEAIFEGVNAMNSDALANELKKMNELLAAINAKLDKVLIVPAADTTPSVDKTKPLAIPGATVKEQKAAADKLAPPLLSPWDRSQSQPYKQVDDEENE